MRTVMVECASSLPALSTLQYSSVWTPSLVIDTVVPVCAGAPSSEECVAATPDNASEAVRLTVTSLFTHADGALADVEGAVRSILMPDTDAVDVFPARSEVLV